MADGMNVYIIGNLTDKLTGDALDAELEKYREAENQLAAFGFGVLSPHHLPADLRGERRKLIRFMMLHASDICYMINDERDSVAEYILADAIGKRIFDWRSIYLPEGVLRGMLGVEKIEN